jgi:predicted Zn-dependent protease
MEAKRTILGLILFVCVFPKISFAGDNEEIKFGFYADKRIVSTQTILFNETVNQKILEIGNKVAKASKKQDMKYTFRVINNPTINAYAAAGGFVYINTGLLDILETEDELAAILAHEIHHTNASHQINFIYAAERDRIIGEIVGAVLSGALAGATQSVYQQNPGAYQINPYMAEYNIQQMRNLGREMGSGIGVSMIKGYGKEQELEADAHAIQYTKKAGYDPNALIGVFKKLTSMRDRLGINEKSYASSLINAEPGLEERIKNTEELLSNPNKNKKHNEE